VANAWELAEKDGQAVFAAQLRHTIAVEEAKQM